MSNYINSYLFFSDNKLGSSILYRCELDAITNCKTLVIHAKLIYSIALDVYNRAVYYTDSKKGRIEYVEYDGTNHKILNRLLHNFKHNFKYSFF